MRRCSNCGKEVSEDERFCTECGQKLMDSYYDVLQVSTRAEPAVITAAYKRLAQTYHPDKSKDPEASAKMAKINVAYEVLSDPIKRAAYDRTFKVTYEPQEPETEQPTEENIIVGVMRFAAEKAAEGKNRTQVADELARMGVPYDVAAEVVKRVFEYRSAVRSREGKKSIGCGLAMLIVGGLVTGITYLAASGPEGGTYLVTTGLFICGAITLVVGIVQYLRS